MADNFDYEKAREEAEKMLEVIERDPQATAPRWNDQIQALVPALYSLAIADMSISIATKSLKDAKVI